MELGRMRRVGSYDLCVVYGEHDEMLGKAVSETGSTTRWTSRACVYTYFSRTHEANRMVSQIYLEPGRFQVGIRDQAPVRDGVTERDPVVSFPDEELAHGALDAVSAEYDVRLVCGPVEKADQHALWVTGRLRDRCAAFVKVAARRVYLAHESVEEGRTRDGTRHR